jgi:HK97 family phage portal protein|nr:MAG TPA: portal protein [Caudoviricetes sp.]
MSQERGKMNFFSNFFGKAKKKISQLREFIEIGGYRAIFSRFGNNQWESELIRSCIRPIAYHTSKAEANSSDKRLERILRDRPNLYMNGVAFLSKVRTMLELKNTAFIIIIRDDRNKVIGFYPMPYTSFEGVLSPTNNLYIKFETQSGRNFTFHWDDIAVLRKDYNENDISGDSNSPILNTLEMLNTSNEGLSNMIKSTANLRGILKTTKSMLDPGDLRQVKEDFVKDYLNISNEGGVAAIDNSYEYQELKASPQVSNYANIKEFRENIMRYYGVNDSILMAKQTPEEMQAFYESRIEPFLMELSIELTSKVFTEREKGFDNYIVFSANTIQFMSTTEKLNLWNMVDRGAMTPNEWRRTLNLPPLQGGDEPIRRLDTAPVGTQTVENEESEEEEN